MNIIRPLWFFANIPLTIHSEMVTDKALLKDVASELWETVKKLRPGLGKQERLQLVLKALITIGDLSDQIQAAIVVGLIAEMEPDEEGKDESKEDALTSTNDVTPSKTETSSARRTVRRRSVG